MIALSKPWDFSLMRNKKNKKNGKDMNQIRIGMIGVGAGWQNGLKLLANLNNHR